MPLAPGEVFAGYTVLRQLGAGGMGAVFLVRHPRLPRVEALKALRPEYSGDPDFARRFLREADLVAGLEHRNVVPVLDRGEDEGRLWLTMRYVDGIDAEQALAEAGGRLPAERAVRIVGEVAAALDHAHRAHLVHRDVKPANVLLTTPAPDEPEQVFLTDFGIAKPLDASTRLTRTGMVVATFDYASPEQIESQPLDARADVYSLGCVLHKLLTGSVPFPGSTVAAALHGHLTMPPPRPTALVPGLPAGLDDVVARAMAKDPADRYPTCRALAAAAAAALAPAATPAAATPAATMPAATTPAAATTTRVPTSPLPAGGAGTEPAPPTAAPAPLPAPAPPTAPPPTAPGPAPATVRDATPPPAAPPAWSPPGQPPAAQHRSGQQPPGAPPARRRRTARLPLALAAVLVLALVAGAVWLLTRDGGRDGSGTAEATGTAGAGTGAPPSAPADDLPRGTPLADDVLVQPREVDGEVDLYLVDAGTGESVGRLTDGGGTDVDPVVSPDRATVVYTRADDAGGVLRAVASDGTGDRELFPAGTCVRPGRPAWDRADPTRLAVTCADGDATALRLVTTGGEVVRELDPGRARIGDLTFSPDGTRVAYWGTDTPGVDGGDVLVLPVDGSGAATQLTDVGPGVDADPAWSPDGTTLALRREVTADQRSIVRLTLDGEEERILTSGSFDQDPIWSPDGSRIAFKSDRPGPLPPAGDHLWVIDADGGDEPVQLATGGEGTDSFAPAWGTR
ncbi:protein kinase domain-containing protein [Blastococcus sp. SYSU D00695]